MRINLARVAMGGLVAGVVLTALNAIKGGAIPAFNAEWAQAMGRLGIEMRGASSGPGTLAFFTATSLVYGLAGVWLYAAIRPRFEDGPRTRILAGAILWLVGYLLPMAGYAGMGLFSARLVALSGGLSLVEMIMAVAAGSWLYRETATRSLASGHG
ncbi:hypothetical protein AAH991_26585 [Microbispora sp. ZYX-F-249]|uniref:Uncharacterized protein n=1 Tax=Microbispora maris TaxID=3144104 RepID=A0ABV0AWN2_9ACTN